MEQPPRRWSPVRSVLLTAYLPIGLFLPIPAVFLALYSVTWKGHLAGLGGIGLLLLPFVLLLRPLLRRKNLWWILALAPAVAACIALPCAAPPGTPLPGSGVGSTYPSPHAYRRWSPFNLIPEIDQVAAAIPALCLVDPRLDAGQLRRVVLPSYREMEREEAYTRLGSALDRMYPQLYAGEFDTGHYDWVVPPHAAGERLPTILFLHGSLGNFKAYLWAWKRFSDRNRCIVVLPSFGVGVWDFPGGTEAALLALDRASSELPIDPDRVWLAGLSNGGVGVSRVAAAAPQRFRGLVYLSAVPELAVLLSQAYTDGWRGRPVLFVHGDRDNRVPVELIDDTVRRLSAAGVDVTKRVLPGEDHFLFLSSLDTMFGAIEDWMRKR